MLTPNEIHALEQVNLNVAKEAHIQTEKYLLDVLEVKKSVEQKATTLFSAYATIALALFGLAAAIMKDAVTSLSPWPFAVAGAFLVLGMACFIWANWPMRYGFTGSLPSMWLVRGRIDGGDEALADMYAYLTQSQQARIDASQRSNARKVLALQLGMGAGALAPLALAGWATWSWYFYP
jgi:hypothetical protein